MARIRIFVIGEGREEVEKELSDQGQKVEFVDEPELAQVFVVTDAALVRELPPLSDPRFRILYVPWEGNEALALARGSMSNGQKLRLAFRGIETASFRAKTQLGEFVALAALAA